MARHKRENKDEGAKALVLTGGILAAMVTFALLWLAVTGIMAWREADGIRTRLENMRAADSAMSTIIDDLHDVADSLGRIHRLLSGPLWQASEHFPAIGDDIRAVRTVVGSTSDFADNALPQLTELADLANMDSIGIREGRIDIPSSDRIIPVLDEVGKALSGSRERIDRIKCDCVPRLGQAIGQIRHTVDATDDGVRSVRAAVRMLGLADEDVTRTILVLAQSNSELRSTGGVAGMWGTLTVNDGAISLGRFASSGETPGISPAPVDVLSDEETHLFTDKLAVWPQDVNMTPDYPRTGQLAHDMWKQSTGTDADAVVAVDLKVLSDVISLFGPVTVDGITLDGSNALDFLAGEVYASYADPLAQDAFFADLTSATFGTLLSHDLHISDLAKSLSQWIGDGHLLAWSAHGNEQEMLEGTPISGSLTRPAAHGESTSQVLGVYVNDAQASKMDRWLDMRIEDRQISTREDGSVEHHVTVTLSNMLRPEDVGMLPQYVVGNLENGAEAGDIQLVVHTYAPAGGGFLEWSQSDGAKPSRNVHDGLKVISSLVRIRPGEKVAIDMRVTTMPGSSHLPMQLRATPCLSMTQGKEVTP